MAAIPIETDAVVVVWARLRMRICPVTTWFECCQYHGKLTDSSS